MAEQTYDTLRVLDLAGDMQNRILAKLAGNPKPWKVYAVPTAGVAARLALFALDSNQDFVVEDDWTKADVIVDDLIVAVPLPTMRPPLARKLPKAGVAK